MKKIISSIFISLVLYTVVQIGNAFSGDVSKLEEPIDKSSVNVEKVELKEESDESKQKIEESSENDNSINEVKEPEKSIEKKNIQQTESNNNQVKEQSKNTEQVIQPEQPKQNEQTITVQEQKNNQIDKSNPWDSLGISEYDYYNKPAHSWAELDFKVSQYGTQEATLAACKSYGDKYTSEHGGQYFCDPVNSYSGSYLGEDFDLINSN